MPQFEFEFSNREEGLAKLSAELERQANIYRGLGVLKDRIMVLVAPRPDKLPKEFIPVVTLGTSVDLKTQADFAGLGIYFDLSAGYDTAGGVTYSNLKLIWIQDGRQYRDKSVDWVRSHIGRNERPATLSDGIALAIAHPNFHYVLENHAIDLPGTAVGSGSAPFLGVWDGRPGLNYRLVDYAYPNVGSASCGS